MNRNKTIIFFGVLFNIFAATTYTMHVTPREENEKQEKSKKRPTIHSILAEFNKNKRIKHTGHDVASEKSSPIEKRGSLSFILNNSKKMDTEVSANYSNDTCGWCNQIIRFKNRQTFYNHVNKHAQEAEKEDGHFKCHWKSEKGVCQKTATRPNRLLDHVRSHTGEKPFKCNYPGCSQACATKASLKRHVKTVHTEEKPYKCKHPGCGASFGRSDDLNDHKRRHSNKKEFKCNHPGCDKAYKTRGNLNNHKKAHQPSPTCPYCGKKFRYLNVHIKNMHSK